MARAPARWHHCLGRRLAAVLACTLGSPAGGQPDLYQDEYDCYREFAQCTERWSPAHKRYCFHLLGVLCMDVSNPDQDPDKFFTGESNEPPGDSLSVDHGRGHEAPEFVTITNTRTTITTTQAFATTTTRATSRAGPWATTRLATTVTTTVPTTTTPQTTQAHPLKLLPKHRIYEPKGEKQQLSRDPWTADAEAMKHCGERFTAPQPNGATDLNGIFLTPVCFTKEGGNHHIFVIGDWGGISQREGMVPVPADHRSPKFPPHRRPFVLGADNCAQLNVAEQMMIKAERSRPDYIINCGDNFYWGGIQDNCGTPVTGCRDHRGQWERVFERIYRGPGLESIQWLGVLGNHDYGGWTFANGWDQTISYTWVGHWVSPPGHALPSLMVRPTGKRRRRPDENEEEGKAETGDQTGADAVAPAAVPRKKKKRRVAAEQPAKDVANAGEAEEARGETVENQEEMGEIEGQPAEEQEDRRGVVHLPNLPGFMGVKKLRHLMEKFGEIGRIYLVPEEGSERAKRVRSGGTRRERFTEGWVEFGDRRLARHVAASLNGTPVGGRKRRNLWRDDIWNMRYLPKFKWRHIREGAVYARQVRKARLEQRLGQVRRENHFFLEQVEKAKEKRNAALRRERKGKTRACDEDPLQASRSRPGRKSTVGKGRGKDSEWEMPDRMLESLLW